MSRRRPQNHHTRCPHCGSKALCRSSWQVTRLIREARFACSNVVCGATFKVQLEAILEFSPSGVPHPSVRLPAASVIQRAAKPPPDPFGPGGTAPDEPPTGDLFAAL